LERIRPQSIRCPSIHSILYFSTPKQLDIGRETTCNPSQHDFEY
jgi:hypothetical protein